MADNSGIERRPRGRPPGSKNKPRLSCDVAQSSAMNVSVLEIAEGSNIVSEAMAYARRRQVGMTFLSCTGQITNISFRNPVPPHSTVSLVGPLHVASLSGSYFDHNAEPAITLSFVGPLGQIVGGMVAGGVTAATRVVMVVGTFSNPVFERLVPTNALQIGGGGGGVGGGGAADDMGRGRLRLRVGLRRRTEGTSSEV